MGEVVEEHFDELLQRVVAHAAASDDHVLRDKAFLGIRHNIRVLQLTQIGRVYGPAQRSELAIRGLVQELRVNEVRDTES